MTELLVIVPARGGSKRLPDKNLRRLGGRTLIERTADVLASAGITAPCLLSTDDDRIARAGEAVGWLVPFRRPAELSGDAAPTLAAVFHALDWYRESRGADPACVMLLQVTSPLRTAECLRRALTLMAARPNIDAVVAVKRLDRTARQIYSVNGDGFIRPLAGDGAGSNPLYTPNGALYMVRTAALRATKSLYPDRTVPLVMDAVGSIDIDDARDWALAEAALAKGLHAEVEEPQASAHEPH